MRLDEWKNSECKDGWYHRFEITGQDRDYVQETCELCGKQVYFKIINGTTENNIYLAHHIRNALFPLHSLFYREYPNFRKQ
jgi:hypothetical protein